MTAAPAKVTHLVSIMASRGREVEPVLDLVTGVWTVELTEEQECSDLIHMGLEHETGESYAECKDGRHTVSVTLVFRQVGKKGSRRWKTKGTVSIDGKFTLDVPLNVILSLFTKPAAAPTGDGKVGAGESKAARPMDIRQRTTITRV